MNDGWLMTLFIAGKCARGLFHDGAATQPSPGQIWNSGNCVCGWLRWFYTFVEYDFPKFGMVSLLINLAVGRPFI